MPKLIAITVCHMEPKIIGASLAQFMRTSGNHPDKWLLVDNHWPIEKENTSYCIQSMADMIDAEVIRPEKNLGGHGGFNFALDYIRPSLEDQILIYDPDSMPLKNNWLNAMIEVLKADPTIGHVSLLPTKVPRRDWLVETIAGHKMAFLDKPEMFNVTLFRAQALRKGLLAPTAFYGHVESSMFEHLRKLDLRNGYLYDFKEEDCPLPHPESYTQWKLLHARGQFLGNYDEFISQK